MIYCLQVFGNVWFDNDEHRYSAFTKSNSRKLQVLQNKVLRLRLKTNLHHRISTKELLHRCQELSVNQLSAYHTLLAVHRAVRGGKPVSIHEKMKLSQRQTNTIHVPNTKLTLSRGGFCCRGALLWNRMPTELRAKESYLSFKKNLKRWIFKEIPATTK